MPDNEKYHREERGPSIRRLWVQFPEPWRGKNQEKGGPPAPQTPAEPLQPHMGHTFATTSAKWPGPPWTDAALALDGMSQGLSFQNMWSLSSCPQIIYLASNPLNRNESNYCTWMSIAISVLLFWEIFIHLVFRLIHLRLWLFIWND